MAAKRYIHRHKINHLSILHHAHWVGIEFDGYADGFPVYDTWECSNCHSNEYYSEGEMT